MVESAWVKLEEEEEDESEGELEGAEGEGEGEGVVGGDDMAVRIIDSPVADQRGKVAVRGQARSRESTRPSTRSHSLSLSLAFPSLLLLSLTQLQQPPCPSSAHSALLSVSPFSNSSAPPSPPSPQLSTRQLLPLQVLGLQVTQRQSLAM